MDQPLVSAVQKASQEVSDAMSHACDICEDKIQQLIQPTLEWTDEEQGLSGTESVDLGWLDFIIANHRCSLCRLVRRVYEQTRPKDWTAEERIHCTMSGSPARLTPSGKRRDWNIDLEFCYRQPGGGSEPIESLWTPAIQLVADDAPLLQIDDGTFQLGRILSPACPDPDFLRACFQTCCNTHGSTCENPVRVSPQSHRFPLSVPGTIPPGMRLIDTAEDRVVLAPQGCSYCILSYVWGHSNFQRLTKANLDQLMTKGALQHVDLPKTIADAIQATKMLGERYLWVDSLCICQDDVLEKTFQIQRMDKIYSQSTLTIVALDQSHADGGLWRDGSRNGRSQQTVESICGLRFICSGPPIDAVLDSSTWIQRAWTYQEYALSRRLLFFTEYQAYYSCETSACAEDYVHRVYGDGVQQMQCFKNDEGLHRWFEAANYPTKWPVLLREYSKRHLTFDSDGLHAVSGVLENFSRGIEDGFLCGLPVSVLFEASMRWYASAPLRRRGPTADGEDLPSWSWVGWVGEVTYEDYEESDAILDARVISEWALEHCDGVLRSTDLHFPSASGRLVSSSSEEDLERAKEALRQIETGILRFKTMSVMFAVEETCWNQFVFSNDYDCEYSGLYKVFDKDSWVGSIHLEHNVAKELSVGLGALHEFIVLSKSGGRLQPLKVPVRPLDDDVDDVPLYSRDLLEDYGCDVYNVMLVSWEEGVAYRRGIGQIHKASFEHASWALKDVKLG